MERQLFYIFREAKNDRQFKLITAFLNCFIIDDDAECEIIEIIEIKPSEIEFSENRMIRKLQDIFFHSELIKLSDLWKSMDRLLNRYYHLRSIQVQNYQMHCILSISLDIDLLYFYISNILSTHFSILYIRSETPLTEKEFRSFPRNELSNEHFEDSNVTIGDDIHFFIDKFKAFKASLSIWEYIVYATMPSNKFLNQLERKKFFSQAFDFEIFDESQQSFIKIECHRKFFPRQVHMIRSFIFMFELWITFVICLILIPTWYRGISKKILNVALSYSSQSYLINFSLCFMTSFSIIFFHWNCFYYLKKWFRVLTLLFKALIRILFPNHWARIVNILNLIFTCLHFYFCYTELSYIENFLSDSI